MKNTILQADDIYIAYHAKKVIEGLSFQLRTGEKLVITGESGVGKSSLINALLGFIPVQKGTISWFGKKLNSKNKDEIRSRIAWLPQDTSLYFETIEEMIQTLFRFKNNRKYLPGKAEIRNQLNELNLKTELLIKKTDEISGGQKQRLMLAAALLLKKEVLILDEPTSSLDEANKKAVTDLILNKKELTVIAVTHDPYWIGKSTQVIAL